MFAVERAITATLVAAALILVSAHARAFCRTTVCPDCPTDQNECPTGLVVQWPRLCISYSLQYEGSKQVPLAAAEEATRAAFAGWQNAQCPGSGLPPSIHVADSYGTVACKHPEYNQTDGNANTIMFRDDSWPYDEATNAIALTTVTFNYKTGDIYDVDMEINGTKTLSTEEVPPPNAFDLQSVLAHETGHFLGLAHSLNPEASMRSTYNEGDTSFRDLGEDDVAGICAIYPPDRTAGACDFLPRGGFSPECGIFPTSGGACTISSGAFAASRHVALAELALAAIASILWRLRRLGTAGRSWSRPPSE